MNTIVITVDGQPVHEISVVSDDVNAADNLADKAAQVIKKGAKVRKGDKVGKVTSTLMAKPGHALVEWGDGMTHERKDELAPAHPGPLSPAEWLEKQSIEVDESQYFSSPKEWLSIEDLLGRYAAHVAKYTARNVRHEAASLTRQYAGQKRNAMNNNEKPPAPMTPAEWAKRARPEVTFSSEALTGMQDYAEYVAEYMRCRLCEAMDEEVKKYYMSRHAQKRIIEKTHTP